MDSVRPLVAALMAQGDHQPIRGALAHPLPLADVVRIRDAALRLAQDSAEDAGQRFDAAHVAALLRGHPHAAFARSGRVFRAMQRSARQAS